jgi:CDGSH-type Zn-finger protein/uncharacterized Fe-S cluster protein YjdI
MEEVRGKHVLLRFDGQRCIHARHCVLSRPDVFVPNVEGEWIHPDRATPEELAELAHACPSGAITYERLDGGPGERAPVVNLVRVREHGPLAVHGELTIAGQPARRATLCRCGQSANKPYCDGSHTAAGFTATGEPATRPSAPLARRDGPVTITPIQNGPLRCTGALEVVSGTGRTVERGDKLFFCRCGQSANKPFCDGTHKRTGFTADGEPPASRSKP